MYNLLTKRVKTYCDVKFCKYETAHNTDISNKFQYTKFNEYEESETVEIDISKSINQKVFTKFNIESFVKVQDIDSFNVFQNVSSEIINISITLCCSKCNQQSICC